MPDQCTPLASEVSRFLAKIRRTESCWLWGDGPLTRYGCFEIRRDGQRFAFTTHRYAYELFRGPIPPGLWVLHTCDVKRCVNPAHLYLGTQADNTRDALERNRMKRGVEHGWARLDDDRVRLIRQLAADGWKQGRIAARVGCGRTTVGYILRGERWAHVA